MRTLVLLAACAALLTGCSSASNTAPSANGNEQKTVSILKNTVPRFFDPCGEELSTWFAHHGLRPSTVVAPEYNETGSGCSFRSDTLSLALLSQPADSDGSTERWVQKVLNAQGTPQSVDIGEHQGEYVVQPTSEHRQGCHVMTPVYYGFLHVTGGPFPGTEQPMPRDCDAARTLAEDLVEYIDASYWHTLGGLLVE